MDSVYVNRSGLLGRPHFGEEQLTLRYLVPGETEVVVGKWLSDNENEEMKVEGTTVLMMKPQR